MYFWLHEVIDDNEFKLTIGFKLNVKPVYIDKLHFKSYACNQIGIGGN